jgi:hypothetical protein
MGPNLLNMFLGASKRLYNSLHWLVCWLVGPLVGPLFGWSIGWSVGPSVATMKLLNLLTSKSGYVEIASPSRLVWIILVYYLKTLPNVTRWMSGGNRIREK